MNEIPIIFPCYNECVRTEATEDQPASIMGALHGNFCDREFHRVKAALSLAAPIVEHVVSLIGSKGDNDTKVDGSREAPMPWNTQAFHDANETYRRLVYWCGLFASQMGVQAPAPALRAWRNDGGQVVGLPADVSAPAARYAVGIMSKWLELQLENIFDQNPDDVAFFHDEIRDVFRIAARFPTRMKARFADVHCPDDECKGRIAVYPPEKYLDDERIVCEKCGRHILPKDYEFMVGVMEQQKQDEKKAALVQARLERKYA